MRQIQPPDNYSLELSIELVRPRAEAENAEKLILAFHGVRRLRVVQADWGVVQFPLLEIR